MNVLVTQRIDEFGTYKERRDSLDMKWHEFVSKVGITPILVPNHLACLKRLLRNVDCSGLLLTGGNTLCSLDGGDAPERTEVEIFLIKIMMEKRLPIIGVCRGFHILHDFFNGDFEKVSGYAGNLHQLHYKNNVHKRENLSVTTHCNFLFKNTQMEVISRDENGYVMSAHDLDNKIYGQIWHPERDINNDIGDIKLFKKIFGV